MSTQTGCTCRSCTVRGLTGPAVVITLGILFLLNQVHAVHLSFHRTWPVLLVVIGLIHLTGALAPSEGHIVGTGPSAPAGTPPPQGLQGQ